MMRCKRCCFSPEFLCFVFLTTFCLRSTSAFGQRVNARIPDLHGVSFTERTVDLPNDLQGKIGVLVIGFTQNSRDSVKGWGVRLGADYGASAAVAFYEMPVLAGVPRMLRGYVAGKIKESVSDGVRSHFVPITENEAAWRAVTSYKGGDDAYVLVVDGQGVIYWQTHDGIRDETYKLLKDQIKALGPSSGRASE